MRTAFSALEPFPLLPVESYSYADAKEHAVHADAWLDLRVEETEKTLNFQDNVTLSRDQRWHGLPPQTLLTPYLEIRLMLNLCSPAPGQTVIDLGCAYGRMAHVLHRHHAGVSFIGYEIEKARVIEGQRILKILNNPNLKIEEKDLAAHEFTPEPAEFYFLYDYGSSDAISKTLNDLKQIATQRPIQVIARGRLTRFQIHRDHPWLAEINPATHTQNFSIYRS